MKFKKGDKVRVKNKTVFKDDINFNFKGFESYKLTDKASKLTEVPAHYQIKGLNQPSMEVIDLIVKHNTSDVKEACYLFMILKYLFRFGKKDRVKDLYKAKDFLDRLIEVQE